MLHAARATATSAAAAARSAAALDLGAAVERSVDSVAMFIHDLFSHGDGDSLVGFGDDCWLPYGESHGLRGLGAFR